MDEGVRASAEVGDRIPKRKATAIECNRRRVAGLGLVVLTIRQHCGDALGWKEV